MVATMKPSIICILVLLISESLGILNIITDNFTVEYYDLKYIAIDAGIDLLNGTPSMRMRFTMKIDLPESTRISINGFRRYANKYRLPVVQIERRAKDFFEMEIYDIQTLWMQRARPPVVWPVQKDVTYRIDGWIPDISKFPIATLPAGKYKISCTEMFANKTKITVVNWFVTFRSGL